MDQTTTGVILRTRPLTETSLIVHWLTGDFGRIHTVAKGARRSKSPFVGKLDLFYRAEFSYHVSRQSQLHTLREVKVLDYSEPLRVSLPYLQQASYFVQLLEQTTELDTPLPGLLELLKDFLEALPRGPARPQTVFSFELKLLDRLGLAPDLDRPALTAGTGALLRRISGGTANEVRSVLFSRPQVEEADRFLHAFLLNHLGRVPKARPLAISGEP